MSAMESLALYLYYSELYHTTNSIYIVYIQNIRLSMINLPKTKVAHNILKNHSLLLLIYGNILIYNILIYSNIVKNPCIGDSQRVMLHLQQIL